MAKVQKALMVLASNPVLTTNPGCLGDFVKSLTQPKEAQDFALVKGLGEPGLQQIPTPVAAKPPPEPQLADVPETSPSPDEQNEKAIAARKAYWSRFKRPVEQTEATDSGKRLAGEMEELLSKPTLELGESAEDDVGKFLLPEHGTSPETPLPAAPPAPPATEVDSEVKKPSPVMKAPPPLDTYMTRLSKMDDVELRCETTKVKSHAAFPNFLLVSNMTMEKFGSQDQIADLASFHEWLDRNLSMGPPIPAPTDPSPPQPPTETASPAPVPVPTHPSPPEQVPPAPETAKPKGKGDSCVAEALKRLQTVDLAHGCRPPQTLSHLGNPEVPCITVVMMDLNGVTQPVSLPLTPEQCRAAGLTLVNPPKNETVEADAKETISKDKCEDTPVHELVPTDEPPEPANLDKARFWLWGKLR